MAIADVDRSGTEVKPTSAQAAAAAAAGEPRELPLGSRALPPSARDAQLRQAARVRQAVVARWLRRLGDPRP